MYIIFNPCGYITSDTLTVITNKYLRFNRVHYGQIGKRITINATKKLRQGQRVRIRCISETDHGAIQMRNTLTFLNRANI
jgi:hypothetical protein